MIAEALSETLPAPLQSDWVVKASVLEEMPKILLLAKHRAQLDAQADLIEFEMARKRSEQELSERKAAEAADAMPEGWCKGCRRWALKGEQCCPHCGRGKHLVKP